MSFNIKSQCIVVLVWELVVCIGINQMVVVEDVVVCCFLELDCEDRVCVEVWCVVVEQILCDFDKLFSDDDKCLIW